MKPLRRILISTLILAFALPPLAAAPPTAFPLDRVRLTGGVLRDVQELHRTGMVGQLDPDKLLYKFRENAGLAQPEGITGGYGSWDDHFIAGHYGGHYLSAASRMYASTGDTSFRDKAVYMVKVLAECQQKLGGGYLSAFPEAKFDNLERNPHGGSVEYYTIHKILAGLVDVAVICRDDLAYQVASRMADHFAARMAKLTPEQIEKLLRTDYTGNPVNEFGGMSEALTDLYGLARERGDANAGRHLEFAKVFIRDWLVDPLLRGEDKLNGLHGNTHAAQVSGIAKYALVTGSQREANAAKQFWKFVTQDHSFVNGSNSFHEKLREPGTEVAGSGVATLNALTSESCNSHNMLKLARSLMEISPDPAVADFHENALLNHLVATVAPDHGKVTYYLSMRPGDHRIHVPDPVCCQGTGIELAGRLAEGLYSHRGKELWIHGFAASTLDWRENGLQLTQETRYPEDGAVRIRIAAKTPAQATLHLRIPGWCHAADIAARREQESSFIGKPDLEQAVQFQGENSSSGIFQGRHWRDAAPGDWFSYRVAIPAQENFKLVCTYWGGETLRRGFGILVEGQKIATQVLENNQPGAFFDVAYPLPNELVHGRQFVTIRFQAKSNFQAGGVFNVRLTPAAQ